MSAVPEIKETPLLKLDLGCGTRKKEGFTGVDRLSLEGVDEVVDLAKREPWPWADSSVDEVHCSHFLEHLPARDRVWFMNELYRVLKPDAKCSMVTPYWASNRAYGDMTHCWPPVSEMFFYYLSKEWRAINCPHDDSRWNPEGYNCDFACTWGYGLHSDPKLQSGNQEFVNFAVTYFKEAAQDLAATLVAKKA